MATRTVHRGARGRFAGASGGKAEQVRVSRRAISGQRVTRSKSLGKAAGAKAKEARQVKIDRAMLATGLVAAGAGVMAVRSGRSDAAFIGGLAASGLGARAAGHAAGNMAGRALVRQGAKRRAARRAASRPPNPAGTKVAS